MAGLSVSSGVAAVLVGLFAVELYFVLWASNSQLPARIDSQASNANSGDFVYPQNSAVSAWRAGALARPLFTPSRRPPAATPQPQAPAAPMDRLSGIIVTPTEQIALFSPSAGSPIIARTNSRLGPFEVVSIDIDSVTVQGPDGVAVMHLDNSYRAQPVKSTPVKTVLPGGISVSLIKVELSSVKPEWPFGLHPF